MQTVQTLYKAVGRDSEVRSHFIRRDILLQTIILLLSFLSLHIVLYLAILKFRLEKIEIRLEKIEIQFIGKKIFNENITALHLKISKFNHKSLKYLP